MTTLTAICPRITPFTIGNVISGIFPRGGQNPRGYLVKLLALTASTRPICPQNQHPEHHPAKHDEIAIEIPYWLRLAWWYETTRSSLGRRRGRHIPAAVPAHLRFRLDRLCAKWARLCAGFHGFYLSLPIQAIQKTIYLTYVICCRYFPRRFLSPCKQNVIFATMATTL